MVLGIVGRVKRTIFTFALIVIVTPIVLNFIPIKFAVKLDDAQQNLEFGRYICVTESKYVDDTGWIAKTDINSHLEKDLAVRMSGNSPNKYLSEKEFDFKWFEVENRFLLIGKVERFEEDKELETILYANLNVDKWKIVYPIRRASIRQYITPKSYLNIYDYDLRKVIKTIWQ
ncbi:hypothetical protein [Paenibacillus durus]|uniref:Uncharacterized protein n=1 Tax=Paenibacillus durus TaxID=44251 RepID=A0A089HTY7_PAEDU|nr:hypothetical protein [Paenibacillus durus]AIQ14542.1 hypothetical protein PDUR_23615 [Paenibacillus durus]